MEVDKLVAADEDGLITLRDIEEMVGVRHGQTVQDWTEAVLERRTADAIALLDVVLPQSGVTAVGLLMQLGTALVGARLAQSLTAQRRNPRQVYDDLMATLKRARPPGLGPWGPAVSLWRKAATDWTPEELDAAIALAYHADRELKSTTLSDDRGIITNMLLGFRLPETVG